MHPLFLPYLLPELYERLIAFAIRIPMLMETPEEIPFLADIYMRRLAEQYGRYHVLTKDAMKTIAGLRWDGGRIQLESFLERLVITADHRSIRPDDITRLYATIYGTETLASGTEAGRSAAADVMNAGRQHDGCGLLVGGMAESDALCADAGADRAQHVPVMSVQAMERERIVRVLAECMGSREKAAEKLGISKTTLWRKLRQYQII